MSQFKSIVERWADDLNRQDFADMKEVLADDAEWRHMSLPAPTRGASAIIDEMLAPGQKLFVPGSFSLSITRLIEEDHHVVGEFAVTGVGASTGKTYESNYVIVFRIDEDGITHAREYVDPTQAAAVLFAS